MEENFDCLQELKVTELKKELRLLGLPVGGTKKELVERLRISKIKRKAEETTSTDVKSKDVTSNHETADSLGDGERKKPKIDLPEVSVSQQVREISPPPERRQGIRPLPDGINTGLLVAAWGVNRQVTGEWWKPYEKHRREDGTIIIMEDIVTFVISVETTECFPPNKRKGINTFTFLSKDCDESIEIFDDSKTMRVRASWDAKNRAAGPPFLQDSSWYFTFKQCHPHLSFQWVVVDMERVS